MITHSKIVMKKRKKSIKNSIFPYKKKDGPSWGILKGKKNKVFSYKTKLGKLKFWQSLFHTKKRWDLQLGSIQILTQKFDPVTF
jgi:hypothetical protein